MPGCWNAGECEADWRHCWLSPPQLHQAECAGRGPWCDVSRWEHSDIVAASSLLGHVASQRSGQKPVYICCFLSSPLLLPTRRYVVPLDMDGVEWSRDGVGWLTFRNIENEISVLLDIALQKRQSKAVKYSHYEELCRRNVLICRAELVPTTRNGDLLTFLFFNYGLFSISVSQCF